MVDVSHYVRFSFFFSIQKGKELYVVDVSHYVNFSLDERHLLSSPGIVLRQDFDGRGTVIPAVLRVPAPAIVALSALPYLLHNITPLTEDF